MDERRKPEIEDVIADLEEPDNLDDLSSVRESISKKSEEASANIRWQKRAGSLVEKVLLFWDRLAKDLGKGSNGSRVYSALNLDTGAMMAVKEYEVDMDALEDTREKVRLDTVFIKIWIITGSGKTTGPTTTNGTANEAMATAITAVNKYTALIPILWICRFRWNSKDYDHRIHNCCSPCNYYGHRYNNWNRGYWNS